MLSFDDILAARARIAGAVRVTPCTRSRAVSERTGNDVFLKLENLQMTGSFKERGALNKLLLLTPEERQRGVIAASAGNHAQGVAYHATRQGVRSTIVMPTGAPLFKVTRTREYGAEVVIHGRGYDEAYEEARRRCDAGGLTFIHAFDDAHVMAGQGTIGLELCEQVPDLDAVVVPIGGGGLISGIALAVKTERPSVRVIGVQSERAPSMQRAVAEPTPTPLPAATLGTIADGIAVRNAGQMTVPLVKKYVDQIVTVDDQEIANAILLLLEREKTVSEGAGGAALAAVLSAKVGLDRARIAVVVGGGNIDVNLLARIIERGLVRDGRLVRLRVRIADHPGGLHRLTGRIAEVGANILEVFHNRAFAHVELGETVVDVTLETRGTQHIDELVALLRSDRYELERLS